MDRNIRKDDITVRIPARVDKGTDKRSFPYSSDGSFRKTAQSTFKILLAYSVLRNHPCPPLGGILCQYPGIECVGWRGLYRDFMLLHHNLQSPNKQKEVFRG